MHKFKISYRPGATSPWEWGFSIFGGYFFPQTFRPAGTKELSGLAFVNNGWNYFLLSELNA
jgi:hypothetical protein